MMLFNRGNETFVKSLKIENYIVNKSIEEKIRLKSEGDESILSSNKILLFSSSNVGSIEFVVFFFLLS